MSIQSYPIDGALASKMIRRMAADAEEGTKFELVPVVTTDLFYIRETHADSYRVTMHGREIGRAQHKANSEALKAAARAAKAKPRFSVKPDAVERMNGIALGIEHYRRQAEEGLVELAVESRIPARIKWCDCGECSACERIAGMRS